MIRLYVVDTSYLLELYAVPGHSSSAAGREVRARFGQAIAESGRFYVPVGVILELCNHIAGVGSGSQRARLAGQLHANVQTSIEDAIPWTITPPDTHLELLQNLASFARSYASQGIGRTDVQMLETAQRLSSRFDATVHIWTRDKRLKALEPADEPNAFV